MEPHEPRDNDVESDVDFNQDVSEMEQYGIDGGEEDDRVQDDIEQTYLGYTDIDESHNQTVDNIDVEAQCFTNQAGDLPETLEHRHGMDRVSGHVLYNQAAVCTIRFDKRIKGLSICNRLLFRNFVTQYLVSLVHC